MPAETLPYHDHAHADGITKGAEYGDGDRFFLFPFGGGGGDEPLDGPCTTLIGGNFVSFMVTSCGNKCIGNFTFESSTDDDRSAVDLGLKYTRVASFKISW